jgi:PAS domain S-box-containing protein
MNQLIEGQPGDTLPATDAVMARKGKDLVQVRTTTTILREAKPHTTLGFLRGDEAAQRPLFLSFMLDDTVRHKAQADMVRVKALLEAVLSNSPYAFSLTRKSDGLIVECNTAYEKLVGRSRLELIERTSIDLGIWARPEDRTRFVTALEAGEQGNTEQLLRFVDAAGKHRLVKGRGALVSFDGQDYVLLMGRDVTESTRREAEQQTVLQNAPLGVATTLGNVIVSANPRVHDIFGLAQGSLIGMRTRDLWMNRDRHDKLEERVLNDLITNGGARFEETFSPDDEQTTLRLIGSVLPDADEGPRRVVWIIEDITQERRTEKALQATAQAAKAASLAKSAFLANMSHELRTPLNGILGLLDLALESDSDTTVQRHQVELARESSRVLADLLNDVLDLSRIEAGRLEIESAPFDLRRLLDSVRTVHEVLAESRGLLLRFEVHLGPSPQVWVLGDATRVRQILNNYLSNALKFTVKGEVVVRVGRLGQLAEQGPVQIEVLDTGPGITPAVQSRLFSAFEQGDASAARRQGGSGLGLAICRELAFLMQGKVGVDSEPGRGSRFWVELPLPPSAPAEATHAAQPPTPDLSGLRVLVAEDNPVNMLITTAMLERAGARVTGVSNGQAALHAVLQADAQDDAFSLLLMDIQMPDMDGLQATQALRLTHDASHLPIIALTAGALQTERDAALQAGMDDFVTKPVDRVHLLACVARHTVRPSTLSSPSTSLLA